MLEQKTRFVGVELYFRDVAQARDFYRDVLGLALSGEQAEHHAQFDTGSAFLCLERKGSESYTSYDKAVLFFEVPDLASAIAKIGSDRFVHTESTWAVLHDPEGHNILLLQRPT